MHIEEVFETPIDESQANHGLELLGDDRLDGVRFTGASQRQQPVPNRGGEIHDAALRHASASRYCCIVERTLQISAALSSAGMFRSLRRAM